MEPDSTDTPDKTNTPISLTFSSCIYYHIGVPGGMARLTPYL